MLVKKRCPQILKSLNPTRALSLHPTRAFSENIWWTMNAVIHIIFVLTGYVWEFNPWTLSFFEVQSFPRALLSENCSLFETDGFHGHLSVHIFWLYEARSRPMNSCTKWLSGTIVLLTTTLNSTPDFSHKKATFLNKILKAVSRRMPWLRNQLISLKPVGEEL